jgi:antitoxin HicB
MTAYRIVLTPDDNGTWLITCPELPSVTSFTESQLDASKHALDAIEEAIAALIVAGVDVLEDHGLAGHVGFIVHLPTLTALKLQLYRACRQAEVTRAELTRRLGWSRNSVDRLFQLDHQSRLEQLDAAARAIGLQFEAQLVEREPA